MEKKILIVEDQFVEANSLRLMLENAGHQVCGIARSVPQALEILNDQQPDVVLLDIMLKGHQSGIELGALLKERNLPFIYISANFNEELLAAAKSTQPDGFLIKPFREKDLLVILEIACYRHEHSFETKLRNEAGFINQLRSMKLQEFGWQEVNLEIARRIQPFIPFDYLGCGFKVDEDVPHNMVSFLRIGFDEYQMIGIKELLVIANLKLHEIVEMQNRTIFHTTPMVYDEAAFADLCAEKNMKRLLADTFELRSHLAIPVEIGGGKRYYFFFFSRRADAYTTEHLSTFQRFQPEIRKVIEEMLVVEKKAPFGEERKADKEDTPKAPGAFSGIIGKSHLLLNVFDQVQQVASVDTSVLILGESGTGKERIADAIHQLSTRSKGPIIKINCAALPSHLIESELFGHEKGAFTGAIEKRIGKFEQANKGTIFLDEIGEMSSDVQAKLLRVLQEREIERIGGKGAIKIDVRVIAATNRILEKEVSQGRFRLDLYYRLNIFPIVMPSLRERKEDIPGLTEHFLQYFNRKAGKKVSGLSEKAMRQLMDYEWPGNIRELENLIERSVLLAKDQLIKDVPLPAHLTHDGREREGDRIKSIEENERDHILWVLKKCKWKIWGTGGAAEILMVPPTTLNSKIKKLGIKKQ